MGRVSSIKKVVKTPWIGQKLGRAKPWMVGGSIGLKKKPKFPKGYKGTM